MVSIPSPVQNYVMLWLISLGSSIGLMLVAAMIWIITGGDVQITSIFVLMFNATASTFILLTMIPVGIFILVFGVLFNALAPILAPVAASLWNFFGNLIVGLLNALPFVSLTFSEVTFVTQMPSTLVQLANRGTVYLVVPQINVVDTIGATVEFLNALRQFLIVSATDASVASGSGIFSP